MISTLIDININFGQNFQSNRQTISQEPTAREPHVALLIMAPGSFVDKHKLTYILFNVMKQSIDLG